MHEPIIDRETFELVASKVKSRKRPDAWGNYSIFAGLVKCGQCGSSMNIRRANQKGKDKIYTCSRYNKFGVKHCSQHRIKFDTLHEIVLGEIPKCAKAALADEEAIERELQMHSESGAVSEREVIERSISSDNERIRELERVIGRLYEDMVSGKLNEDTFNSILEQKQAEQATLKNRVRLNSERIAEREQEEIDNVRWIETIKEYADIRELDATTLNRLIRVIVIHEDLDGETVRQTFEIHWNFKGSNENT